MRRSLFLALFPALFLGSATLATAQTPSEDVVDFFGSVASTLQDAHSDDPKVPTDARPFLDKFDSRMLGFAVFRDEIEALVAAAHVGSVIDFVTDEGDDRKRTLQLDWLLEIEDEQPRRQILKCTIERQGKRWKITALEPIEFFKQ
jgi:hypothetical protein